MIRSALLALLGLAAVAAFAGPARADSTDVAKNETPSPAPSVSATPLRPSHPTTIEGSVVAVDFTKYTITLQSGPTAAAKKWDVNVSPSTTFQGKPNFTAISDVRKGMNLRVTASQKGDDYLAQVITLVR